jgi:4-amino-4-deoxy-L-arabinose transferase-like glycosyltransferase
MVFIVRMFVVYHIGQRDAQFLGPDSKGYIDPAIALLKQSSFSYNAAAPRDPNIVRTPGYPLFIAFIFSLFGENITCIIIAQVILSFLAAYLLYMLALYLFGQEVAFWAPILYLLDMNSFYLSMLAYTETLFVALAVAFFYFFARWYDKPKTISALLMGLFISLGTIVRPILYYYFFILLVFIAGRFWSKRAGFARSTAHLAAYILPFLIIVGGWQYRNHIVAGTWEITSLTGQNMLYYHGASVYGKVKGIPLEKARNEGSTLLTRQTYTPDQWIQASKRKGLELIINHPVMFLQGQFAGIAKTFISPGVNGLAQQLTLEKPISIGHDELLLTLKQKGPGTDFLQWLRLNCKRALLTIYQLVYLCMIYLGVICAVILRNVAIRKGSAGANLRMHLLYIFYMIALVPGVGSESRFRVPVMPLFALISSVGWVAMLRGGSKRAEDSKKTELPGPVA